MEEQVTLGGDHPITDWYKRHTLEYSMVEKRLADTRAKFMAADRESQVDMLVKSYVNAVISQRTHVDTYEPAYTQWVNGASMDKAFSSVQYPNQKVDWLSRTLSDMSHFNKVCQYLENGELDKAHVYMSDNFVGLSFMKAAFTAAMLGFTTFMCLDTNVQRAMGYSDVHNIKNRDEYLSLCDDIVAKFPIDVDPFILQWVIFDYQRGYHETHKPFFKSLETWSELDRSV